MGRGNADIRKYTRFDVECEDIPFQTSHRRRMHADIFALTLNGAICSKHQVVYLHWRPCLSDPKDDHILELAVASSTSTIVTHNVRDFKRTTEFGIRAITPGRLLEELKWEH
ncbi:MAG: PIN domain-containing protein [Gemmatimonadota bacterium]|nr:PIN domain-containing protein [Gemmatimonadota bacterium]